MKAYSTYSDKILLDLLSDSDEAAFTELYNRYWQRLFTIAYNRLKEVQSAEDIVHDVFTVIWKNRQKQNIEQPDQYLASVTKYMVLAKIKKKTTEKIHNQNLTHTTATVVDFPVEASLYYKHLLGIIKNEVEKLPEKCRLIFKSSRNDGKSVKEIAQDLQISPKSVENQLYKALQKLKLATRSLFSFLH